MAQILIPVHPMSQASFAYTIIDGLKVLVSRHPRIQQTVVTQLFKRQYDILMPYGSQLYPPQSGTKNWASGQ
jgi:hypothetical protein